MNLYVMEWVVLSPSQEADYAGHINTPERVNILVERAPHRADEDWQRS